MAAVGGGAVFTAACWLTLSGVAAGLTQGSAKMTGYGLLGLLPFLTSFAFGRNAWRCSLMSIDAHAESSTRLRAGLTIALTAVLVLLVPAVPDLVVTLLVGPGTPRL